MSEKGKRDSMIYYTPVTHRRLAARDLYPMIYGYFLHKTFAVVQEEAPAFHDLIFCKGSQKTALKKK
ncbi:MAG TPA: hypothetical protein ENL15_02805, partial [Firmicutes bacterium]|nr:hypothetical protein [Bacillota bacterium]